MTIRLLSVLLTGLLLSGCSRDGRGGATIAGPKDLRGRLCGTVVGSAMGEIVERIQPGVEFCAFNDYPSAVEALRLGKIDAVPLDTAMLCRIAEPFARMGDEKACRLVDLLERMLADGVISDSESRRISMILERL